MKGELSLLKKQYTMLTKILVIIVGVILFSLVFVSLNFYHIFPGHLETSSYFSREDFNYYTKITESIKKNKKVDFEEIFNFEWDKMYIFSRPNEVDDGLEKAGIDNELGVVDTSWENINQVFFIKDNKTVYRFVFNQNFMVFKEQSVMISRGTAIFNGKYWFRSLTLY